METKLNEAFEAALISHGQTVAQAAAQASIDAHNTAALAGLSQEVCEREQLEAFAAALN